MIVKCGEEVYLLTRRLMFRHDNGDTTALRILHITLRLDHIGRRAPLPTDSPIRLWWGLLSGARSTDGCKKETTRRRTNDFSSWNARIFCQALIKLYLLLVTWFLQRLCRNQQSL